MSKTSIYEVATHRWLTLCGGHRDEPFVQCAPGVFIVALDEKNQVLFLREPRIYDNVKVLSLPGGTVENDEPSSETADRELREETGFSAGRLDFLNRFHPLSRHADWCIDVYVARDLIYAPLNGDETYEIEVVRHPLADFEALVSSDKVSSDEVSSDELNDSTIVAALYMTRRFLENEDRAE